MNVFAYCARSFRLSVRRASGVEPLTSPPGSFHAFDPGALEGRDLIYFKLHGLADQPYWYGDNWLTALSADLIRQADLAGAVVFAANCYLPESPMLKALLASGARAVIGGSGPNYARLAGIDGADLLGLWVRIGLRAGMDAARAFRLARKRLQIKHTFGKSKAVEDALGFELWTPLSKAV